MSRRFVKTLDAHDFFRCSDPRLCGEIRQRLLRPVFEMRQKALRNLAIAVLTRWDPPNRREALREMALDLEEGADVLMVKPALPYLDVLSEAAQEV